MRLVVVMCCAVLAGLSAHTQQPGAASLEEHLKELAAAAQTLEAKLPGFACHESLTSQEVRKGKVKKQIRAEGNLRVLPQGDGRMGEQFTATDINGKPAKPGPLRAPLFVRGGFREALMVFREADQKCFEFHLDAGRLVFQSRPEPLAGCADASGISGVAQLDDTGTLTRLDLHNDADATEARHAIPHAVLDLTPVELGGTRFLLSTHVVAEHPEDGSIYRWDANYTGCQLYQATVKIGDATVVPDAGRK